MVTHWGGVKGRRHTGDKQETLRDPQQCSGIQVSQCSRAVEWNYPFWDTRTSHLMRTVWKCPHRGARSSRMKRKVPSAGFIVLQSCICKSTCEHWLRWISNDFLLLESELLRYLCLKADWEKRKALQSYKSLSQPYNKRSQLYLIIWKDLIMQPIFEGIIFELSWRNFVSEVST